MPRTVLVGSTLLDPSSRGPEPVARTILIEDGRIAGWLAPDARTDGERIDAAGLWAIPGLVDAHYAPFQHSSAGDAPPHSRTVAHNLLRERRCLQRWLESGVTSLCSAGAPHNLDLDLRDALAAGSLRGPRLLAAGCPISAYSGGQLQEAGVAVEVSGVDQARRVARQQIKAGADLLVVCVDAHAWPWVDASLLPALDEAEMHAMVDEAQHANVPVYAICASTRAVQWAVSAGVNAVVPTYDLDATATQALQNCATALVRIAASPTMASEGVNPVQTAGECFRNGIVSSLGSGPICERWCFAEDGRLLVEAGVDPYHVLQGATTHSAQLLGRVHEFGSLRPGCVADIVLLDGNPVERVANLGKVRAVIQAGRVAHWSREVGGRDTPTQH